jgi:DNA-directed RNA polymerase subunit F
MDIKAYQIQRDADLKEFETQYSELKNKYTSALRSAVQADPQQQSQLINTILEINSNLASEVRAFVAKTGDTYDPSEIQHLTDDLQKYQEEYTKIKQSQDMTETLKMVLNEDQDKIKNMRFQFNLYIALLGIGIVIILSYIVWLSMPSLPTLPLPVSQ